MKIGTLTDAQFKRLEIAKTLHKFGHLETWQELFAYQIFCKDLHQIKEISNFAKKSLNGEDIKLPLMNNSIKLEITDK
jgi:hypothetical protein